MQYQVPQFIEIEDKIFGPLTFKQFVYVAGGAGMCFIIYRFLPMPFSLLIVVPLGGFAGALAFYKVNNRPFIDAVESAVRFYLGGKLYLWQKRDKPPTPEEISQIPKGGIYVPKLSESRLKELTWSLDINETVSNNATMKRDERLQTFEGLPVDIFKKIGK
ncbi:MAG: seg [Candidatus Taylorbacteria bacterium]|nr:seg [Candidatus Taylorbacteria bacterium]